MLYTIGMIIRKASAHDANKIHLFGLTIPEINVSSSGDFMSLSELMTVLSSKNTVAYVADNEDEYISGFCLARLDDPDRRFDGQACLVYIAVSEVFRGCGIAKSLFDKTIDELKGLGCKYIYTWACPTSGAVRFFEKQGLIAGRTCVWMDSGEIC